MIGIRFRLYRLKIISPTKAMKIKHRPLPLAAALMALAGLPFTVATATEPVSAPTPSLPKGLNSSDWSSIRKTYDAGKHAIIAKDDGSFIARNPGQQWNVEFDGRGFTAKPDSAGWTWGLDLASYGFESANKAIGAEKASVSHNGNKVAYQWDGNLSEWFLNDSRGVEQGWTFQHRPDGGTGNGPLCLDLTVRGALVPQVTDEGAGISFQNEEGGSALTYGGLKAWDADGKVLAVRFQNVGANRVRVAVEERAARYPITIDPIAQQAYLKASNTGAGDQFGVSIAVSGDIVVVGAPLEDSASTGVNGNQSSNTKSNSGAAYVFVREGTTWTQQAYLKASNTDINDTFGICVDVSDTSDSIIVGAPGESSGSNGVNGNEDDNGQGGSGAAYVFVREGTSWSQQAYLKASNSDANDGFGRSVVIHDNKAIVGASGEDSISKGVNSSQGDNTASGAGAAYVFKRVGSTWSQQAYLKASNTEANDNFGASVAMAEDIVVVGAIGEDSEATGVDGNENDNTVSSSGAAYVFRFIDNVWVQQAYLKASNTGASDAFGFFVSVSGDTVVVGAPQEDSNASGINGDEENNGATDSGAAYVFIGPDGNWSQEAYVKASNSEAGDFFGYSAAVSGNIMMIGAPLEDSSATGIDGSEDNNLLLDSGAAYLFNRTDGEWNQTAYLKASNTNASDVFGVTVSFSGDTVVVGAYFEDSSATGVNHSQSSNSASSAGAVYVYFTPKPEIVVHKPNGKNVKDGLYTKEFPDVKKGKIGAPFTFTILNSGSADLKNLLITITGADKKSFIVSGPVDETVSPGDSTTFTLKFAPKDRRKQTAEIHIQNNDANENPFDMKLEGFGLAP